MVTSHAALQIKRNVCKLCLQCRPQQYPSPLNRYLFPPGRCLRFTVPPPYSTSITSTKPQTAEPSPHSWHSQPLYHERLVRLRQQHSATPTCSPPSVRSPLELSSTSLPRPCTRAATAVVVVLNSLTTYASALQQQNDYDALPPVPLCCGAPSYCTLHDRRSTGALPRHFYALTIRRASAHQADYPPLSGPPPAWPYRHRTQRRT